MGPFCNTNVINQSIVTAGGAGSNPFVSPSIGNGLRKSQTLAWSGGRAPVEMQAPPPPFPWQESRGHNGALSLILLSYISPVLEAEGQRRSFTCRHPALSGHLQRPQRLYARRTGWQHCPIPGHQAPAKKTEHTRVTGEVSAAQATDGLR